MQKTQIKSYNSAYFACSDFAIFDTILSEMKKILIFVVAMAMSVVHAGAAVRDGNATQRTTSQKRISTTQSAERPTNVRTNILNSGRNATSRTTTGAASVRQPANIITRGAITPQKQSVNPAVSARAATQNQTPVSETRTGAAYEVCKTAFFTCMDQFCALKNDDYRRCSCSNRISDMEKQRATLTEAGQQLTIFTENLDVVGLTAAQATAMRTASEGENALSNDTSASKALLQAIMNSISGGDTNVSGKYSDLNTINMSYDLTTAFGLDSNQIISSYNGQDLYTAVYPQCRHAVAADCNNASLQRAINAYLMAIEQDCNTVQTAIEERQSQMKAAIREGSAMLDLARVENRRKHNSDDITTCINNVESAILSEEVCGANYHKCLDNGEFIDITTGAPIAGIVKFYELGKLLTFSPGIDAANQQLSKRANNRTFVFNFENRTKKFAKPALDKCTEIADDVWSAYLDKAMLAIYYAQQSKVSEIKQGCFDFVSNCYTDSETSITAAMSELIGSGTTILTPNKIALTTQMCTDYVASCNNMFADEGVGDIIEQYVNSRQAADTLTACRAVVKQCFDKYGGTGYENFYYPYSGLFSPGSAGDWFTLYDLTKTSNTTYLSPCAEQLTNIDACNDTELIEQAFGGFDRMYTNYDTDTDQLSFNFYPTEITNGQIRYGIVDNSGAKMRNRALRPVGVATEIYNQITDTLNIQCTNINGRFVERQFIKENLYGGKNKDNICLWYPQQPTSAAQTHYRNQIQLGVMYGMFPETLDTNNIPIIPNQIDGKDFYGENMCPRDYNLNVDSVFWGACLCWENGGRRSKNGQNATCVAELPVINSAAPETTIMDAACYSNTSNDPIATWNYDASNSTTSTFYFWCTPPKLNTAGQVCPYGYNPIVVDDAYVCADSLTHTSESEDVKLIFDLLPASLNK